MSNEPEGGPAPDIPRRALFHFHPKLVAKLDNAAPAGTLKFRVVAGRRLEWLPVNPRTVTWRHGPLAGRAVR